VPEPPYPPLSDGVVALRPWEPADVPAIAEACAEAEIARWLDLIPQPYTEDDARWYVEHCERGWREGISSNFAIVEVSSGRVVGSMGARHLEPEQGVTEVGYWIRADARGHGFAARALRLISDWLLEDLGMARVQLRADTENLASRRVAERARYVAEGTLRSARFNGRLGGRRDFVIYSLLPTDPR
jgi:RimJ/RimL family protein N-acetyltransferase